ncbi:MAG: acetyl-CoA C-acyltransferase [Robiginitomaculum sp.]|nr:MAG: acetyl-CoA C-acyltransferase [Robiginitomaculum sp.]
MTNVVIVDALRTPTGRYRGSLANVRADHLAAHLLEVLAERNEGLVEHVDDVVFGCVTQVGEQSANIARTALLSAGWPYTIPGFTIDRKCGSGEAAVHQAVGAIASGMVDVVIAGGAESMSRVRMGGNREIYGEAFGWAINERYKLGGQGAAAEGICDKWELTRTELDIFALESHKRAHLAAVSGYFDRETTKVPIAKLSEKNADNTAEFLERDETIRPTSTLEKMSTLKTVFREDGGRVTAGNASQISDGAAALVLMSEEKAKSLNLKPRARIRAFTTVGSDPELMLTGPLTATSSVLKNAGLDISDIDLFEVNEAFAPVPLMWMRETGVDHARLNVNGGAIALGHPLGASGARIMTTLLHELERRKSKFGLQTICCAGGLGTATIIERL